MKVYVALGFPERRAFLGKERAIAWARKLVAARGGPVVYRESPDADNPGCVWSAMEGGLFIVASVIAIELDDTLDAGEPLVGDYAPGTFGAHLAEAHRRIQAERKAAPEPAPPPASYGLGWLCGPGEYTREPEPKALTVCGRCGEATGDGFTIGVSDVDLSFVCSACVKAGVVPEITLCGEKSTVRFNDPPEPVREDQFAVVVNRGAGAGVDIYRYRGGEIDVCKEPSRFAPPLGAAGESRLYVYRDGQTLTHAETWDRPLTAAEVRAICEARAAGTPAPAPEPKSWRELPAQF